MPSPEITILLAEDDDGHALLVQRNLQRAGLPHHLIRFADGGEVLEYIDRQGQSSNSASQSRLVVVLDIRMPRVSGLEVLRRLKADSQTACIPVIMLTTTDDPREIANCYDLGCNVYVTKPIVYESFVEAITRLGHFLTVVRVPASIRSLA